MKDYYLSLEEMWHDALRETRFLEIAEWRRRRARFHAMRRRGTSLREGLSFGREMKCDNVKRRDE